MGTDHSASISYPPLTRNGRRRARRIMRIAAQYYRGERVPDQQTRIIAQAILERVTRT